MRTCFLFCLLFGFFQTHAQKEFTELLSQFNRTEIQPTDIQSITEYTYGTFTMEEEVEPDTVITYNGQEVKLYLLEKVVISYDQPNERVEQTYDKSGEPSMTTTYVFDAEGHPLSMKLDMGDSPGAALMNSLKEYQYDEQGRITTILNNGEEAFGIAYTEGGHIQTLKVDAGFMKMIITGKETAEQIRYDMSVDTTGVEMGFAKMLIEKFESDPKEYCVMMRGENSDSYSWYKEDRETETTNKTSTSIIAHGTLHKLSNQQFGPEETLTEHTTFTYNEQGDIVTMKNEIEGTIKTNEFDKEGNMTLEHEQYFYTNHRYDKKGNRTASIRLSGLQDEPSIQNYTIRKIIYR